MHSNISLVCVTGTPGIGKSIFQFSLLHWLVTVEYVTSIVLEVQSKRFLFKRDCPVLEGGTTDFEDTLNDTKAW